MADEEAKPARSKGLIFAIIGIIIALVIVIVLIILLLFREPNMQSEPKSADPITTKDASLVHIGPLYSMPAPFVINLISPTNKSYLKVSITLELSNPKLSPEIDQKIPILQSKIIETISSKSVEEVATEKGKERIKSELIERLNQVLIDGSIKNIFFTEFIVQ
ncbi:MAG: flagellar basal body-associated FliL family protein [Helicobacter sp.]|nr:flagellar basal body-associated FliL family protein [Helicobacter sp.]